MNEIVDIETGKCGSCKSWNLKTSALAKHGAGNCAHLPAYSFTGISSQCEKFEDAGSAVVQKRIAWLSEHRFRILELIF